jgi:hypothetical protein
VRKAFRAEAGNTLVVADYGQLELRILAHVAGCQSMITAFELGGDFHSRTALGMYDHIKEAIAEGRWGLAGGAGSDGRCGGGCDAVVGARMRVQQQRGVGAACYVCTAIDVVSVTRRAVQGTV